MTFVQRFFKHPFVKSGLLWTGAAISIAEMLVGMSLAPLGAGKALAAILTGHLIGGTLMTAMALSCAKLQLNVMQTVGKCFGSLGGTFFAIANIIQLFGWTSVMIYDASLVADSCLKISPAAWTLLIGALLALWTARGIASTGLLNAIIITGLLAVEAFITCNIPFSKIPAAPEQQTLSFISAIEISAAMPLSWLPLVGDYINSKEHAKGQAITGALCYNIVSCWMYTIGVLAALTVGAADIPAVFKLAGLGRFGLLLVLVSTVITTFFDAWSAGCSMQSITNKLNVKIVSFITITTGTILALVFSMDNITGFLYTIGAVFAPLAGITITEVLLIRREFTIQRVNWRNMAIWLSGFILYFILLKFECPAGSALPAIFFSGVLTFIFAIKKR